MELYAAVTRRFKVIFSQQEQMKKFRIYDLVEVKTHLYLYLINTHYFSNYNIQID
jgi:hypothetical protein